MLMILLLYSTLDVFGNFISKNLNLELTKVADWLKLNKLLSNIKIHGISYASKTSQYIKYRD